MKKYIFKTKDEMATAAATSVVQALKHAIREKGQANIVLGTGTSQAEMYEHLTASKGVDWFKSIGTSKSAGHKLFSVSGDCERPGVYEFPFGKGRRFAKAGLWSAIFGGFQTGVTYEYQPGPLLSFGNLFYYGNLADIDTGARTLDRWFNTAGFERSAAKGPAAFHRRVFPTLVSGLRADGTNQWNANMRRDFRFRERASLQIRLDMVNLQNRSQFAAPDTNPFSTNFGKITAATANANRFIQLQGRIRF